MPKFYHFHALCCPPMNYGLSDSFQKDVPQLKAACKWKNCYTGRKYQLRFAAGLYWLIDMEQSGGHYISPVPLNEGGAKIWELIESGMSMSDICKQFSGIYEIPLAQAQRDVSEFIDQLRRKHIDLEGLE